MAAPTPDVTCELASLKVGLSKRRTLVQMKAGKPTDISLFRKDASEPTKSRHWVNWVASPRYGQRGWSAFARRANAASTGACSVMKSSSPGWLPGILRSDRNA